MINWHRVACLAIAIAFLAITYSCYLVMIVLDRV